VDVPLVAGAGLQFAFEGVEIAPNTSCKVTMLAPLWSMILAIRGTSP